MGLDEVAVEIRLACLGPSLTCQGFPLAEKAPLCVARIDYFTHGADLIMLQGSDMELHNHPLREIVSQE